MKTFSINTLGCKVNQYESQQIRELLEQLGLNQLETSKNKPDLVIVNTCCVTHTASAKSRQNIRKAQKLNPDAVVVVTGCLPTVQTGELSNPGKNVHLIRHRQTIADKLRQMVNGKAPVSNYQSSRTYQTSQISQDTVNTTIRTENDAEIKLKKLTNLSKLPQLTSFKGHTRAFLKIQDGCDGYCSYCIIPKARPDVHSKPAEAVLEEAQRLVKAGHKEIVVTGIFLGAYGQGTVRRKNWAGRTNDKLANLLDKLAMIPNLVRIRLSSLEPADITPRLLDVFCRHRNIMPHLHLSVQSGSDAVLKQMARQYRAQEFAETIEMIKSRLDRPAVTGDFIVGFPGETEADFEQTVDLAREVGFAKMHVFCFSARQGTAAADMQDTVNNEVMKERSKRLRNLEIKLGYKFRRQFVGETAEILIENDSEEISGRSERYFSVTVKNPKNKLSKGQLVKVKLIENTRNGMTGQAL